MDRFERLPRYDASPLQRWLNRARVRAYSRVVVALFAAYWLFWVISGSGWLDRSGNPLGGDFVAFYSASRLSLEGRTEALHTTELFEVQRETTGEGTAAFPWHYPPPYLLIIAPLALVPFALALPLWWAATVPLFLATVRAVTKDRLALLAVVAFPGFLLNFAMGQNAFIVCGLLGLALVHVDRRPGLAGLLLGAAAFKPQFLPVILLALLAGRRWKALAGFAIACGGLAAGSVAALGPGVWSDFLAHISVSSDLVFAGLVPWTKMETITSTLLLLGASRSVALGSQAVVGVIAVAVTVHAWRATITPQTRNAITVLAALLATPYAMDYDLALTALPLLWLQARAAATGWRPWEKEAMLAVWAAPWAAIGVASATGVMLTPFALAALFALLVQRARAEAAAAARAPSEALPVAA